MNTLELNSTAEGLYTYLRNNVSDPRESIAILGLCLCILYDKNADPALLPFSTFARDFHDSLIATHKDASLPGPETVQ